MRPYESPGAWEGTGKVSEGTVAAEAASAPQLSFTDDPIPDKTWWTRAACAGMDTNIWFPGYEISEQSPEQRVKYADDTATAKAICFSCPVRPDCLEAHLREPDGIWGGLTFTERKALARERGLRVERFRTCGTTASYAAGCRCERCCEARRTDERRRYNAARGVKMSRRRQRSA